MDTAQEIVKTLYDGYSLTDTEIAQRVGSSQPTIWRIRTGATKDCSSALYISICALKNSFRRGNCGRSSEIDLSEVKGV